MFFSLFSSYSGSHVGETLMGIVSDIPRMCFSQQDIDHLRISRKRGGISKHDIRDAIFSDTAVIISLETTLINRSR